MFPYWHIGISDAVFKTFVDGLVLLLAFLNNLNRQFFSKSVFVDSPHVGQGGIYFGALHLEGQLGRSATFRN